MKKYTISVLTERGIFDFDGFESSLEELTIKLGEEYKLSVKHETLFSIENESIKLFLGTELLKSAAITIREEK